MTSQPTSEPVYPFVAIDVPQHLAEVAAEQLFALGAEGVEQRDATTLVRGSDAQTVTLVGAFPTRELALEALEAFDDELSPRLEEVVGDAWRDEWKKFYEPFAISPRVFVRPPWRPAPADLPAGTQVLELEPGRAFGTGLHASTALVARMLDDAADGLAGAAVLDVGCGSGILSLIAVRTFASRAVALDIDPEAVDVARENAERNGLAGKVTFLAGEVTAVAGTFPVVLANIQADVLVPLAGELRARLAPGGLLLLSGILVGQKEQVLAAYEGMTLERSLTEGEWVALALRG